MARKNVQKFNASEWTEENWLAFTGIDPKTASWAFERVAKILEPQVGAFAEYFYHRVPKHPAWERVAERFNLENLKRTQEEYLLSLLHLSLGPDYSTKRHAVARAHLRADIDHRWYIAAYGIYLDVFWQAIGELGSTSDESLKIGLSVAKMINYEIQLVTDEYIRDRENRLKDQSAAFPRAMVKAVESRDDTTGHHVEDIEDMAEALARKAGFTEEEIGIARIGGMLHDLGKIAIPDAVLLKPAALDEKEWQIMKEHTTKGFQILSEIPGYRDVALVARHHHERWDGQGYPDGLTGPAIPVAARVVTIVDSFHAMISKRPYKEPFAITKALQEIERNLGTQFDPLLGRIFLEEFASITRDRLGQHRTNKAEQPNRA